MWIKVINLWFFKNEIVIGKLSLVSVYDIII